VSKRSKSSHRWLQEHFSDRFVQQAKAEGWRSRAVYKLEEADRSARLFRPGMTVVDLGAAPGAWSQYARRRIGPAGRVVASDILPMDAIAGVEFVLGDFREEAVVAAIRQALGGDAGSTPADLLLSDMAPNFSGIDAVDQPRAMHLAELALELADQVLKPGGSALIKVFQGVGFQELLARARAQFTKVRFLKPEASRARSAETYLLATGRRMV
jgi:23S rRNA (uridine2552-2'-O)-methyltransferase